MVLKRKIRKSRLMFGEGLEDKALLKHLLCIFGIDEREDIHILVGCGTGGSAKDVIDDAARVIGNFNKRLVILDRDNKTDEEVKILTDYADKKRVNCHFVTPCLEAVILDIIDSSIKWKKKSVQECKHEVESKHIARKKRTNEHAYKKLTIQKILVAAENNSELRFLIDYITIN